MPFTSGVYSGLVNSFNAAVSGTIIDPADWNDLFADIESALNDVSAGSIYATTDVASASTCNIGAAATASVRITGTTTITSLGASTNRFRMVYFAGALTLTHNATSLILPGGANITTAAGDAAIMLSDDSGNWRCLAYSPATPFGTTDVASASTCDIGAIATSVARITGTTTITSLGTRANRMRLVYFAGALTLTHNATSLILPGGVNITTAAGDAAIVISDASGNWRCLSYQRQTISTYYATYAALQAATGGSSTAASVGGRATSGDGADGAFRWLAGNQTALVTADPQHGIYVPPTSDTTGASGVWARLTTDAPYNVRWFGAVGDGSTNDATAIQAAITYAYTAGGGTVYMGEGSWKISTPIALKSFVRIVGDGHASKILVTSAAAGAFTQSAGSQVWGGGVENVRIVADTGAAGSTIFNLTSIQNCVFRGLVVDGFTTGKFLSIQSATVSSPDTVPLATGNSIFNVWDDITVYGCATLMEIGRAHV